ncbi:MAG TPA: hypothetical protein VIG47_06955, partial [Gemmatimonadaceae bacterium]
LTIVGSAVDTIVESSAASSITSTSPLNAIRTLRCGSAAGSPVPVEGAVTATRRVLELPAKLE